MKDETRNSIKKTVTVKMKKRNSKWNGQCATNEEILKERKIILTIDC